ncbi:MAG: metallophosphoesterase [Maribacter sp.]
MKNLLRPILLYLIVLAILPDSISAQNKENDQDQHFTMIIASDPQLYWWEWDEGINCESVSYKNYEIPNVCDSKRLKQKCQAYPCVKAMAIKTNKWQVKAMNDIAKNKNKWPKTVALSNENRILKPVGVIMNGDLVSHGMLKFQELRQYKKYYDNDKGKGKETVLKLPIFPGLGNHDYKYKGMHNGENKNGTAVDAINYIKNWKNNPPSISLGSNPPTIPVIRSDEGSLAYSFEIAGYHFIQLHNNPEYNTTFSHGKRKKKKKYVIKNSFEWLKNDIQKANSLGFKIVINMHDYDHKYKTGNNSDFKDAIMGKNIVAIFAGHIHEKNGRANYLKPGDGNEIPVFKSGSSEYNTFLLVDFGPSSMTVGVIERNEEKGNARFKNPENKSKLKTYTFANIK